MAASSAGVEPDKNLSHAHWGTFRTPIMENQMENKKENEIETENYRIVHVVDLRKLKTHFRRRLTFLPGAL